MIRDSLSQWCKSELERLEREKSREKRRLDIEEAHKKGKRIRRERYLNAPVMNLQGEIVGRKSLSTGEKDQP